MKTINQTLIILGTFFCSVLAFSLSANAACPAAPVGAANDTVVQMRAIGGNAGMGAANVLDATEEGAMVYDDANNTVKVCDGLNWVELGGGGGGGSYDYDPTNGYFVITDAAGTAFTGGLTEANEYCHQILSKGMWKGSPGVNLNPSKVKAFLCDEASCQNTDPNTTYYFASVANYFSGGASFTTNGSGQGPGDSAQWSGLSYFDGSHDFFTGRAAGTSTLWSNSPHAGQTCNSWTHSGASYRGRAGMSGQTNQSRWNGNNPQCNNPHLIICMLHPGL